MDNQRRAAPSFAIYILDNAHVRILCLAVNNIGYRCVSTVGINSHYISVSTPPPLSTKNSKSFKTRSEISPDKMLTRIKTKFP